MPPVAAPSQLPAWVLAVATAMVLAAGGWWWMATAPVPPVAHAAAPAEREEPSADIDERLPEEGKVLPATAGVLMERQVTLRAGGEISWAGAVEGERYELRFACFGEGVLVVDAIDESRQVARQERLRMQSDQVAAEIVDCSPEVATVQFVGTPGLVVEVTLGAGRALVAAQIAATGR